MIASFPMYALPQMKQSMQSWWKNIAVRLASHGINAPEVLSDTGSDLIEHWTSPNLLLSQTCGFPLVSELKQQVKLVGTLNYSTQYCRGPNYCSLILVHETDKRQTLEEFRGTRFTFNGTDSQSGFNALRNMLLDAELGIPFFGENIVSGQHINSIKTVASKKADLCSVDCVSHALIAKYQPALIENTRILTVTQLTAGLPLISSVNTSDEIIELVFTAMKSICEDKALSGLNDSLLIRDISKVSFESYQAQIRAPETKIMSL